MSQIKGLKIMSWLFGNKENASNIDWKVLNSLEQLEDFKAQSNDKLVVFFKHSTRCSISSMAKSKFERTWNYDESKAIPVYLDLIAHREISNALADEFGVSHQSPQILVIKDEICIYDNSHNQIDATSLSKYIA